MRGRPTSLTPEVAETILAAVRAGNYKATACAAAGIHRDTLNDWEHRGARGEEPYREFSDALQKAEAESEVELLREIRSAQPAVVQVQGADVWQSRAWIMERRWPKKWAQKVRLAVTEELGALHERLRRNLDEETFRRVVDATREDASGDSAGTQH